MEGNAQKFDEIVTGWGDYVTKRVMALGIMKPEEIKAIVVSAFKMGLREMVHAVTTKEETEYLKLLEQIQKLKLNSPQYIKLGYQLSIHRKKKSFANRIMNIVNRENRYNLLCEFIKEKYGEKALEGFSDSAVTEEMEQNL